MSCRFARRRFRQFDRIRKRCILRIASEKCGFGLGPEPNLQRRSQAIAPIGTDGEIVLFDCFARESGREGGVADEARGERLTFALSLGEHKREYH